MMLPSDQNIRLTLLRSSIRKFCEQEIKPYTHKLDQDEKFSIELTQKLAKFGLFGCCAKPESGGQNMSHLEYIVCVEEIARVDSSQAATIAAHNSLGVWPIETFGSTAQKTHYLTKITCDRLWALGLTEAVAGSDIQSIETEAKWDSVSKKWILKGSKIWITNSATDLTLGLTIFAKMAIYSEHHRKFSCFLLPANTTNLIRREMKGKMMWRASNTGEIYLDHVEVPEDALLGKLGQGFDIIQKTLSTGRLSIAAIGLGLAKGAYEMALNYAKERKCFGKSISQHQVIAFKLADMTTRIHAAESLLYKSCELKDHNQDFSQHAAMAKLYCSEVAEYCAREGQQIFGGYGLMKEYPIERFYRDAAILRIGEGTSEIQRLIISKKIGCFS